MPESIPRIYAVSACLLGIRCRYNGGHKLTPQVMEFLKNKQAVLVCPELLSGLPIPRPPAEIQAGDGRRVLREEARVKLADGSDVTEAFRRGAGAALELVKHGRATHAILKERSPSCGVRRIYRAGRLKEGKGVFAALLEAEGVNVISEEEIPGE